MRKLLTVILLSLSAAMLFAGAWPISSTGIFPSEDLYTTERIGIEANGRLIPAILALPLGATEPVPGVVLLHQTGADKDIFMPVLPAFAANGIAALAIDLPGSGESEESYTLYNYTTATEDAVAAKAYLASLDAVDGDRIGILGWSQGGTNSIVIASQGLGFKSVVLWAGSLNLTSRLGTPAMYADAVKNGWTWLTFTWRSPFPLGLQWFQEVYSTDLIAKLGEIEVPLLTINGENDALVDPSLGPLIADITGNERSSFTFLPGADHNFNFFPNFNAEIVSKLAGTTIAWFLDTL